MKKEFTIKKSTRQYKKYMAIFTSPKRTVHFGDKRYQQYRDSTPLGLYSHLNHMDTTRRKRYYNRHGKNAELYSPKWFSHKYLW